MVDNARRAARRWDARANNWHGQVSASPAFATIRDAVLSAAQIRTTDRCVDLGAGTGFVTLPMARAGARVLAVDASKQMLARLDEYAREEGLANVTARVDDLATCCLEPASLDVAISLYALHHLTHKAKQELVARVRDWLVPGGRLVVADMMFGRGGSGRDRRLYVAKVGPLLRRGPGGVWRIAKNTARFGLGFGPERPAPPRFWTNALRDAGFINISYTAVVAEAGLVMGTVPGATREKAAVRTAAVSRAGDKEPHPGRVREQRSPVWSRGS